MMNVIKCCRSILARTYIKLAEKSHSFFGGGKYLHIRVNSPNLLIVFSGFNSDDNRTYNYVRSLRKLKCDKLYILDTWGYKGSYYWYDGGNNNPEKAVIQLVKKIIENYHYEHVYTAGTSKGGTAAIYFGLYLKADAVYAGANQYFIGNYLSRSPHINILEAMMGSADNISIEMLNHKLSNLINNYKDPKTQIYLLYSLEEQEMTYQTDMKYMISDLKYNGFNVVEKKEKFQYHHDIGKCFPSFVLHNF